MAKPTNLKQIWIQSKEIQKLAHGVIACYLVGGKKTKLAMVIWRKNIHMKWYHIWVYLAFYPSEHVDCKIYSKICYYDFIFGRDVHFFVCQTTLSTRVYNFLA
jgi:hypothetical protein